NRTIGIVGINATGKSTLMEIFEGLNDFYLKSLSIDQTSLAHSFRSNKNRIRIRAFLASNINDRFCVDTTFINTLPDESKTTAGNREWVVNEEKVYHSVQAAPKSKYFEFKENQLVAQRSQLSQKELVLLSAKDSIFKIVLRPLSPFYDVISTVSLTDSNVVKSFADETPPELLEYLDNSIEYLKYKIDDSGKTLSYTLKFKGEDNVIVVSNLNDIANYLSSGTIKGITLFYEFLNALRQGATLLVDEIELHVNKQIVRDFIGFFSDPKTNVNNATLVYSSHYIELTDDLERQDEEYILIRNGQTELCRLNDAKVRTELKNSEIFQNNYLKGTAPNYRRYMNLKKTIVQHNLSLTKATVEKNSAGENRRDVK
ncbi:MAG TPA: ATP-binding protein, partial [Lactobacillus sp.]|nr:ATP-binding protein [Lactobacillus sp.]